jgi:hypothetical protein
MRRASKRIPESAEKTVWTALNIPEAIFVEDYAAILGSTRIA